MTDADAERLRRDEFADAQREETGQRLRGGRAVFRQPAGLAGPAIAAGGLVVLLAPGAVVPLGMALLGVVAIRLSQRLRDPVSAIDRATRAVGLVTTALVGGALLLWPEPTTTVLGLLVGGYLAVTGLADIVRAWAVTRAGRWSVVSGALKVALGVTVLALPEVVASFAVLAIGSGWFVAGFALTLLTVRRGVPVTPAMLERILPEWLDGRAATSTDRAAILHTLFFEGDDADERLARFFVLMAFASTISILGVVIDSTAVVVGAMLVAPLFTPLMGTSAAVITGWPRRAARSGLVAVAASAVAVVVAFVFTAWLPGSLDLEQNTQITARVAPTVVDLLIALAAGGAGAYATSRTDVSAALPGVAVAIALVPPLSVVGAAAQAGAPSLAFGALLLFATNAVGIMFAGGVVFVLTGVTPVRRIAQRRLWIRETVAGVAVVGVSVFAALAVSTPQRLFRSDSSNDARPVAEAWAGRDDEVVSIAVDGDAVEILVAGPAEPAAVDLLADRLAATLRHDVELTVRWTPRAVVRARGAPPD